MKRAAKLEAYLYSLGRPSLRLSSSRANKLCLHELTASLQVGKSASRRVGTCLSGPPVFCCRGWAASGLDGGADKLRWRAASWRQIGPQLGAGKGGRSMETGGRLMAGRPTRRRAGSLNCCRRLLRPPAANDMAPAPRLRGPAIWRLLARQKTSRVRGGALGAS